jgi:hypothetical protein
MGLGYLFSLQSRSTSTKEMLTKFYSDRQ